MNRRGISAAAAVVAIHCLVACNDVGDLTGGQPPASAKDATDEAEDGAGEADVREATAATETGDVGDVSMSDVVVDASFPLSGRSPDCLACAQSSCAMFVSGCESIVGVASEGPAQGTPKAELCVETLTCFLKTGCAADNVSNCYCLIDPNTLLMESLCHPPAESEIGACKTELEQSLETTDLNHIRSRSADLTKGGGWAATLLQCLTDNHCTACFHPGDGGLDGSEPDANDATTASDVGVPAE